MLWWRRRKHPLLTNDEFNEELNRSVVAAEKILDAPTTEYFPMLEIVRPELTELIALVPEGRDESIDDFEEFARSLGRKLYGKKKTAPQAVFIHFPTVKDNVIIHGATSDGRLNAAVIYCERNEEGYLEWIESVIAPFPTDPFETHYARSVMSAYADPPRSGA